MKKILCTVICLAMLLTAFPMAVFADDEPKDTIAIYGAGPQIMDTLGVSLDTAFDATKEIATTVLDAAKDVADTTLDASKDIVDTVLDAAKNILEQFKDIKAGAWYEEAVKFCVENGLMGGMEADYFGTQEEVTRAMVVTMLWRLDGEKYVNYIMPYTDVNEEAYYAEAVRWAAAEKIISGVTETEFAPNEPISRQDLAAVIYNYVKYVGGGFTGSWMFLLPFDDMADIASYASEAVHWMYMNHIMNGVTEKTFLPKETATRAEVATMFKTFAEFKAEEEAKKLPILGGMEEVADGTITEELKSYFDKVMEGFTGVGYTPIKLVGTQVVAGRNYKFLCDAQVVYPGAAKTQKYVTIYVALDGSCSIKDITDVE